MKKQDIWMFVFVGLFLFFVTMIFVENSSFVNEGITGRVSEATTKSSVVVSKYAAIDLSSALVGGIAFEDVATLPANNVEAVGNDDLPTDPGTLYSVDISEDSNVPVDVCVKVDGPMTNGVGDEIPLAGETYNNDISTEPLVGSEKPFTLESYTKASEGIEGGSSDYFRFWLDVLATQAPGTYENTVRFKGVIAGTTNAECEPQICGNGVMESPEECDGADDAACLGLCIANGEVNECTCPV